ncbi:MAG: dolichyl-phosphate beta-glucosyltransferase [Bdellovibrio sp.]
METLSVVIPAFNEEGRLPKTLQTLKEMESAGLLKFIIEEVIVVDDGSGDNTVGWSESFAKSWSKLKVVKLPQNRGKGAAVHAGFAEARAKWVLVADADMATPWDEMNKFVSQLDKFDLFMGSRALAESDIVVRQHWLRQNMGKTFNKILKGLVGLPYKDTQCGFKMVRNDEIFRQQILKKLTVDRFAWDVELILAEQKFNGRIVEVPIRWSHQEASRVHIVRDSLEMFFTVLKLRFRLW